MNHKKLQHILIDKEVSQKELAEAAGVSDAFMSYVLNGKREAPLKVVKAIAKFLEVSIDELVGE